MDNRKENLSLLPETDGMNHGGLFEQWAKIEYKEDEYYVTMSGVLSPMPKNVSDLEDVYKGILEEELLILKNVKIQ